MLEGIDNSILYSALHVGFVRNKLSPVCLGRASSGANSDDRELAVGVLADWLPYGDKC
jgi:hypothetical protein